MAYAGVFKGLLKSGDYSDLTIRCGDREWKVHKNILCTQCDFFKTACNGKFKEGTTSVLEMHDDDPEALDLMLHSFYGYDYAEECIADETSALHHHTRIIPVANKYMLSQLKQTAVEKFINTIKQVWATDDFADAVDAVYAQGEGAEDQLKTTIIEVVIDHAKVLLHDEAHSRFQKVLETHAALAVDLVKALTKEPLGNMEWYQCTGEDCQNFGMVFGHAAGRAQPEYSCPSLCSWIPKQTLDVWKKRRPCEEVMKVLSTSTAERLPLGYRWFKCPKTTCQKIDMAFGFPAGTTGPYAFICPCDCGTTIETNDRGQYQVKGSF